MNKRKGIDLGSLDDFAVGDLIGGKKKEKTNIKENVLGAISYAPITQFCEDEENARLMFDEDQLNGLADSMRQINPVTKEKRGIVEPLIVIPYVGDEDYLYTVVSGNRRLRAAKIAKLELVPFLVRETIDGFDKFVVNDQREQLSPFEIASFLHKAVSVDKLKAKEVAETLGRKESFVADHLPLAKAPAFIREVYQRGLCRSTQALVLLQRSLKKFHAEIEEFCNSYLEKDEEITTKSAREFIQTLKDEEKVNTNAIDKLKSNAEPEISDSSPVQKSEKVSSEVEESAINEEIGSDEIDPMEFEGVMREDNARRVSKSLVLVGVHDDRYGEIIYRISTPGTLWFKYRDDGTELLVAAKDVLLEGIEEY